MACNEKNETEKTYASSRPKRFEVKVLDVSEEYLAHRMTSLDNFAAFMIALDELMKHEHLNRPKDWRLRKSVIERVANRLIDIRPSWKAEVKDVMKTHFEQVN